MGSSGPGRWPGPPYSIPTQLSIRVHPIRQGGALRIAAIALSASIPPLLLRIPMPTTTSRDGTTIPYSVTGSGPALVLVDGALCSRVFGPMPGYAKALADSFTVYWYDRRGRGESTDTPPFTIQKEIDDLAAMIQVAGGTPYLFGSSSGAALALQG